ncbi:MAG: isocitrate/isopropylmalate family dehydrogenase [Pseudomonadota bacterium]
MVINAKRVVVIEGDDAAPEAVRPAVELIDQLNCGIEWVRPLIGQADVDRGGSGFSDEARRAIDQSDATLFGATSGASGAALNYLRWGRQTYANVRPARWLPGFASPLAHPERVDFVLLRENLEDAYVAAEDDIGKLQHFDTRSRTWQKPINAIDFGEGKFALKIITERGSERIIRFAFDLAVKRKSQGYPGKVTLSAKYNMLPQTDGLFREVGESIAKEYRDIRFETFVVDDFCRRMVAAPEALDVVVLPNLYGDLLSDLSAGMIGGLGLTPSGCYGADYAYFESVHGTAPDIAGQGIINPTATILSAALMLDHVGEEAAASRLRKAVETVYRAGVSLPRDQGGQASTREFTEAVARAL